MPVLAGRRVLALGQAVDLVVEEQQLDRDVAAQRVDQVVAADRERVAVAADDPDREVVAGGGDAGRQRQGAAVDAVHPVGVHVVDEAAGAADPGDEDRLLRRHAELRHQRLDAGEDRVVAAARAPARFLVGLEVLLGQRRQGAAVAVAAVPVLAHASTSRIAPLELLGEDRQALHFVVADRVDQELAADHAQQLAGVHLGDQHLREGADDLAGVARQRVEVAQVGGRDRDARARAPAGRRPGSTP